jgi:hypothetical protein
MRAKSDPVLAVFDLIQNRLLYPTCFQEVLLPET